MSLLSLNDISKHYGNQVVLDDITLSIDSGSPIAIIGPNGAGKTSLFSIIAGFMQASSGNVTFLGQQVPGTSQFGNMAILPQDAQLDPRFTLLKQLVFYCQLQGLNGKQAKAEVKRVLSLVGLQDQLHKKPQELSHGMRKRACIAQALIGEPQLVLLDEATAGLDPANAKKIRELIASLAENVTFILSSHDLSELERLCDRVYVLADGKLSNYININESTDHSESAFLTVRFKNAPQSKFIDTIQAQVSVKSVQQIQAREYVFEYDFNHTDFDIDLIVLMKQHNQDYQHIYNGKTLENQLFGN